MVQTWCRDLMVHPTNQPHLWHCFQNQPQVMCRGEEVFPIPARESTEPMLLPSWWRFVALGLWLWKNSGQGWELGARILWATLTLVWEKTFLSLEPWCSHVVNEGQSGLSGPFSGRVCEWVFQNLGMTLPLKRQLNMGLLTRRVRRMVWKLEGLINTFLSFAIVVLVCVLYSKGSCFSAEFAQEENDNILHLNKFPVKLHIWKMGPFNPWGRKGVTNFSSSFVNQYWMFSQTSNVSLPTSSIYPLPSSPTSRWQIELDLLQPEQREF